MDGPSVAHGFDERPGQSPAPVDAEDSAPFRAPADEESEEEGPVEIEIDWDATWKLRAVLARHAAKAPAAAAALQAKAPQQRQKQQQPPGKGAPWALSVTRVTATRWTRSGVIRSTIAERRRVNALNLEPGGDFKYPLRREVREVDGLGRPKGP